MANTYKWFISGMEAYPAFTPEGASNPLSNVVFKINWHRQIDDGLGNALEISGTQDIAFDANSEFVDYTKLTETEVLGWLESSIGQEGMADLDAKLTAKLTDQLNPPVVKLPLPWATP